MSKWMKFQLVCAQFPIEKVHRPMHGVSFLTCRHKFNFFWRTAADDGTEKEKEEEKKYGKSVSIELEKKFAAELQIRFNSHESHDRSHKHTHTLTRSIFTCYNFFVCAAKNSI